MAKTVVPYRQGARGEVFVRMFTDGCISGRLARGHPVMVDVEASIIDRGDGEIMRGRVRERDVVAMVVDDDRYAFAEPTARGTKLTFETPEAAAQALEALGWTVRPPAPAGDAMARIRELAGGRFRAVEHHQEWRVRDMWARCDDFLFATDELAARRHAAEMNGENDELDGHAEPIGEPWWRVDHRTSRPGAAGLVEWVVRSRDGARVDEIFDQRHLAQACADDLNIHHEATK